MGGVVVGEVVLVRVQAALLARSPSLLARVGPEQRRLLLVQAGVLVVVVVLVIVFVVLGVLFLLLVAVLVAAPSATPPPGGVNSDQRSNTKPLFRKQRRDYRLESAVSRAKSQQSLVNWLGVSASGVNAHAPEHNSQNAKRYSVKLDSILVHRTIRS